MGMVVVRIPGGRWCTQEVGDAVYWKRAGGMHAAGEPGLYSR